MNRARILLALATALSLTISAAAECTPMEKASDKLGEVACIRGKVLRTSEGTNGVRFLHFCEENTACPFVVVMFSNNLRDVGDYRLLAGNTIEINGKVKQYREQVEIILRDRKQLRGEYANLPNLPKDFDVSQHGNFSAGKFSGPKRSTSRSSRTKTPKEVDQQDE